MDSKNNMELRFIEYSVENYLNIFNELLAHGKKNFLIHGFNQDTTEFLNKAKVNSQSKSAKFYVIPESSMVFRYEDINYECEIDNIEVIFLFITDAKELSGTLMDYIKVKNCIIYAPLTGHYYKNRPVLIQSVPKSGTHLLFECMKAFGFKEPPSFDLPKYKDKLKSDYFYNLQHMTSDYIALQYSKIRNFILTFCNSVILFIYRDPRDIAVSLSYYLTSQKQYHILYQYMKGLSREEQITTVIKGSYPIPVYFNDYLMFSGNIRELMLLYSNWLKYPFSNIIPLRFEDIVGPKGGGDLEVQLQTIWRLQLGLHVPGTPRDFSEKIFSERTLTFRRGQVGSYKEDFTKEHYELFNALPQDFMEIYGYGEQSKAEKPQQSFTGSIPIDEALMEPILIEEGYKGFNIVLYQCKFYALAQSIWPVDLIHEAKSILNEYQKCGKCFIGNSLDEVKQLVYKRDKSFVERIASVLYHIVEKIKRSSVES